MRIPITPLVFTALALADLASAQAPAAAAPAAPPAVAKVALTCAPSSAAVGDPVTCTAQALAGDGKTGIPNYTLALHGAPATANATFPAEITTLASGNVVFGVVVNSMPSPNCSQSSFTLTLTDPADAHGTIKQDATLTVTPAGGFAGGELFRLVGGSALTFAPGGTPTGKLFGEMYVDWGIGCVSSNPGLEPGQARKHCGDSGDNAKFGSPWRYWLQADLMSQTSATPATASGVAQLLSGTDVSSLASLNAGSVQNFGMRTGITRRLAVTGFDLGGIPHGTSSTAVEWVLGGGFSTPINGPVPPPQVFCKQPGAGSAVCRPLSGSTVPANDSDQLLVITTPAANGYYWNWETGFRFQTFYDHFTDSHQPAMTELTLGQDAAITEGRFRPAVFSLQGFWPLPGSDEFFIVFGGSVQIGGSHTVGRFGPTNLALVDNASYTGPYLGPQFTQQTGPTVNADSYHVGIAVDIVDFAKNHLAAVFQNSKSNP